jgi:Spy/CpxP family protein refolding chaperone
MGVTKMKDQVKIQTIALIPAFMMITLCLVLTASSVHAFGPGSRDRGGFSRDSKPSENKILNLSPEQEAQLKGLRDKFLEETVFLRSEIPIKLAELRTLWTDPKPDKDRINTKKKEIMELYTELQIKATDHRVLAQNFLTPEQAEKLPVFGLRLDIEINLGIATGFRP